MQFFKKTLLLFFSVAFLTPLHSEQKMENEMTHLFSKDRMLCTTMTQGQYVRFNRCRNGEVMTGIRDLDPLTIYCTTLLANCPNQIDRHERD